MSHAGNNMSTTKKAASRVGSGELVRCSCGSITFIKSLRVSGTWTTILTLKPDGSVQAEGVGDFVRNLAEPKTIRCDECKKRHPNPDAPNIQDVPRPARQNEKETS